MEELVNLVAERSGLPKDKAQVAVQTVIGVLKERLPPPLAGQLDGLLAGGGQAGQLGNLPGSLGGLFKDR
jgi:hypothetical protein